MLIFVGVKMYRNVYKNKKLAAKMRDEGSNRRIYDLSGNFLGRYEVSLNVTFDAKGNIIGEGDLLRTLIPKT
jgi:hypothetical protein